MKDSRMHERDKNAFKILVREPEGQGPLQRYEHGWKDNIRRNLKKIGCDSVDWMYLALDRDQWQTLVNTVINLQVL
jgi:hypothetical protein